MVRLIAGGSYHDAHTRPLYEEYCLLQFKHNGNYKMVRRYTNGVSNNNESLLESATFRCCENKYLTRTSTTGTYRVDGLNTGPE